MRGSRRRRGGPAERTRECCSSSVLWRLRGPRSYVEAVVHLCGPRVSRVSRAFRQSRDVRWQANVLYGCSDSVHGLAIATGRTHGDPETESGRSYHAEARS